MRGTVTNHDGYVLIRENRSIYTRSAELLEEELLLLGKKKLKRFASSGISDHSKSGRTQTKLNARGGMSLGPLRRDRRSSRPGVRLHKLRFEEL